MKDEAERMRAAVNAQVADDGARVLLHRAINAWCDRPASNLEKRIDAAGVYLSNLRVHPVPDCRALSVGRALNAGPVHLGWAASADTDRIGNASASLTCYAESPADAIAAVLEEAAAWVKKRKDIR